jgi:hypothetical protein
LFAYVPAAEGKQMEVQQVGDHNDEKNKVVVKRKLAKQYALQATAGQALVLMEKAGIPQEHRPSSAQLNNFRPKQQELREKLIADTVGSLLQFIQSPPQEIVICDGAVCTADRVQITFFAEPAKTWLGANSHLSSFCMDFTFGIGAKGLALGGCGPLGMHQAGARRPQVRMMPFLLQIAQTEDQVAHQELFRQYMALMKEAEVHVTDGYCDCFCYQSLKTLVEVRWQKRKGI